MMGDFSQEILESKEGGFLLLESYSIRAHNINILIN